MKKITLSPIPSKPRLIGRAQLNGVSKGGEHPVWSRAGFKPRSRIQLISLLLISLLSLPGKAAFALDKINVTLPSKSFQFIIFPLAKERGYMKEEGIDLNVVVMASTPACKPCVAGEMDFTGSGSSALVAVTQGNAPLKTVLAVNDQVLQWLMVRPQYASLKNLKTKKSL